MIPITKQTRRELNKVILLNRKIRSNSISFKILLSFYDGKDDQYVVDRFSHIIKTKNPRKDSHRYIHHLQSIGLVQRTQNNKSFTITNKGRWYVIASKLGIPLFSLILLANVYVFQKNMKKLNLDDFYVVGFFFDKIKNLITHSYRVHGALVKKNYVYKQSNQTIRIPQYAYEKLTQYDTDFEEIAKWYKQLDVQIDTTLLKDRMLFKNKIPQSYNLETSTTYCCKKLKL